MDEKSPPNAPTPMKTAKSSSSIVPTKEKNEGSWEVGESGLARPGGRGTELMDMDRPRQTVPFTEEELVEHKYRKSPFLCMKRFGSINTKDIFDINKEYTRIGRKKANVFFPDAQISPQHALISCKDGGHWIQDVGSEHGTFLVLSDYHHSRHEYMLQPGDIFFLGNTEIKVEQIDYRQQIEYFDDMQGHIDDSVNDEFFALDTEVGYDWGPFVSVVEKSNSTKEHSKRRRSSRRGSAESSLLSLPVMGNCKIVDKTHVKSKPSFLSDQPIWLFQEDEKDELEGRFILSVYYPDAKKIKSSLKRRRRLVFENAIELKVIFKKIKDVYELPESITELCISEGDEITELKLEDAFDIDFYPKSWNIKVEGSKMIFSGTRKLHFNQEAKRVTFEKGLIEDDDEDSDEDETDEKKTATIDEKFNMREGELLEDVKIREEGPTVKEIRTVSYGRKRKTQIRRYSVIAKISDIPSNRTIEALKNARRRVKSGQVWHDVSDTKDASSLAQCTTYVESMKLSVTNKDGEKVSATFVPTDDKRMFMLGKSDKCDVVIKDSTVADMQAQIVNKKGSFYLVDCAGHEENGGTLVRLSASGQMSAQSSIEIGDIWIFGTTDNVNEGLKVVIRRIDDLKTFQEAWNRVACYVQDWHTYPKLPKGMFQLAHLQIDVGRGEDCRGKADLRINDYDIAALHASIVRLEPRYYIEPIACQKRKGTYVLLGRAPFVRKRPYLLKEGSIFRFGKTSMEVLEIKAPKKKAPAPVTASKTIEELTMGVDLTFSDAMRDPRIADPEDFDEGNEMEMVQKLKDKINEKKEAKISAALEGESGKNMTEEEKKKYEAKRKQLQEQKKKMIMKKLAALKKPKPYILPEQKYGNDPRKNKEFKKLERYMVLKVTTGPLRKQLIGITEDTVTFGNARGLKSGGDFIFFSDETLSPHNTLIQYNDGGFYLSDLESVDGTFLRLPDNDYYRLEIGDVLRMGHTELTIMASTWAAKRNTACCSIL